MCSPYWTSLASFVSFLFYAKIRFFKYKLLEDDNKFLIEAKLKKIILFLDSKKSLPLLYFISSFYDTYFLIDKISWLFLEKEFK